MTNNPKISIIVPVYKTEALLKRCVDSITCQTYDNLEIILVDDGSPDNSGKICDSYANKDSRIIVIHQKNAGLSGARNSGLKIATGNYIGFVDSDDWIEPTMYQHMLETLLKHNANIVECGLVETIDIDTTTKREGEIKIEKRMDSLKRIIKNQDFSVWRRLYPKYLIKDILFVEGKNSEDVYFTLNTFKNINTCIYMSHPLYNYYVGGSSITRGSYSLKVMDSVDAALYLQEKIYEEESDVNLKEITRNFVLEVLLFNYKHLQLNSIHDKKLTYRKKIKKLIDENYKNDSNLELRLSHLLPIRFFNLLIKFNKNLNNLKKSVFQ